MGFQFLVLTTFTTFGLNLRCLGSFFWMPDGIFDLTVGGGKLGHEKPQNFIIQSANLVFK